MSDNWTNTDTRICWFIGAIATYLIGPAVPVILFIVLAGEMFHNAWNSIRKDLQ